MKTIEESRREFAERIRSVAGLPSAKLVEAVQRRIGGYAARFFMAVGIFHCSGARTEDGDARLRAAFPRGVDSVHGLRREPHDPGSECWLHAPTFCLSSRQIHPAA